jgi:hypothetical protein
MSEKKYNYRKGAGPHHYKWAPINEVPNIKRHRNHLKGIDCDGVYDNIVTYVYEITSNGHLAYVHCDYVE